MTYTINIDYKAKYYGNKRMASAIKYIVIHYTANSGATATAKSNANYFANVTTRKSSAHYIVDENSIIYQCVPDLNIAWSVGDSQKYTNGGASMKKIITNTNSISIEMVSHSDSNGNYYIPENTIKRTIELISDLQLKYKISNNNIYMHWHVTGKLCPKPFIDDNTKWIKFKKDLLMHNLSYQIQNKFRLSDGTIKYLENYKYAQALFEKLLNNDKNFSEETLNYMKEYKYWDVLKIKLGIY